MQPRTHTEAESYREAVPFENLNTNSKFSFNSLVQSEHFPRLTLAAGAAFSGYTHNERSAEEVSVGPTGKWLACRLR